MYIYIKESFGGVICFISNNSKDQTDLAIRFYSQQQTWQTFPRLGICINYTLLFQQSALKPFTCYSLSILLESFSSYLCALK